MRLLIWGWLISLFILPEVIASSVLPESKVGHLVGDTMRGQRMSDVFRSTERSPGTDMYALLAA